MSAYPSGFAGNVSALTFETGAMDPDFVELFTLAQNSILNRRERLVVKLRYGLDGGRPRTLEEIGRQLAVSRERVGQVLDKAHRKIAGRGRREIEDSKLNGACAELLLYVRNAVRPEEAGAAERLADFVENVLLYLPTRTHALPLGSILAFPDRKTSELHQAEAQAILRQRRYERSKQDKASVRFRSLIPDVIWPDQPKLLAEMDWDSFSRAREVSITGTGDAGSFYSEKLERDVQYESLLEQDFLLCLEHAKEVVFYQEQPLVISYTVGNQERTYYPDVLIILSDGRGLVVEIKPVFQMALEQNLTKWGALRKFCAKAGLGLLVTDGRRSIKQVQRHKVKPEFEKAVISALQGGPLCWAEYRAIKDQFEPGRDDFAALILRHRLRWHLSPFALCRP